MYSSFNVDKDLNQQEAYCCPFVSKSDKAWHSRWFKSSQYRFFHPCSCETYLNHLKWGKKEKREKVIQL